MMFYKTWCEHEVFYINDLYDYIGDFFSHEAFPRQYNLNVNIICTITNFWIQYELLGRTYSKITMQTSLKKYNIQI